MPVQDRQLAVVRAEGFDGYLETLRKCSGAALNAVRFGHYSSLESARADAQEYLAAGPGREALVRQPR